jgi:hypothetical protein
MGAYCRNIIVSLLSIIFFETCDMLPPPPPCFDPSHMCVVCVVYVMCAVYIRMCGVCAVCVVCVCIEGVYACVVCVCV